MSNIPRQVLGAMENIAGKVINATPIDLTVTASIVQVRNVEVGQYRVRHNGSTMTAYSLDPLRVYRIGEEVYMLVPAGDFSAKKIILGTARLGDGSSFADRHQMMNQWRRIGPNWLSPEWYWRNTDGTRRTDLRNSGICAIHPDNISEITALPQVIGTDPALATHPAPNENFAGENLQAAYRGFLFERPAVNQTVTFPSPDPGTPPAPAPPPRTYNTTPVADPVITGLHASRVRRAGAQMNAARINEIDGIFQHFSNVMDFFQVRANFQTRFSATHTCGDYGLLIECWIDNPNWKDGRPIAGHEDELPTKLVQFKMAAFSPEMPFNGNPYAFNTPTPQTMIFAVPRGALRGLVRVSLYQDDGWATDVTPNYGAVTPDNPVPDWSSTPASRITDRNNILVSDVEIHWVEQINLANKMYWIQIDTPNGTDIWDRNHGPWRPTGPIAGPEWDPANPDALLRARLFYGNRELTNEENCRFYWFREKIDASVTDASGNSMVSDRDEFGRNWHDLSGDGWAPITWNFPNNENRVGLAYRPADSFAFGMWGSGWGDRPNLDNYVTPDLNTAPPNPWSGGLPAVDRRVAFNEMRVPVAQVPWQWRYRVICVYHSGGLEAAVDESGRQGVIVSGEVTVRNALSLWDFELPNPQMSHNGNNTLIRVRDNNNPWEEYPTFDETRMPLANLDWRNQWWFTGFNGTNTIRGSLNHADPETAAQNLLIRHGMIRINDFMNQEIMHFTAQVFNAIGQPNRTHEIANVHLFLGQPDGPPFLVTFSGRREFNYFADGTIKPESSLIELNKISATVMWAGPYGCDYRVQWFAPDGVTPLTDPGNALHTNPVVGHQDERSMMYNMWAATTPGGNINNMNAVRFRVRDYLDDTRTRNTFIFRITLFTRPDEPYDFPCQIFFRKDGDVGTNGTPWSAHILPCNTGFASDGIRQPAFFYPLTVPRPLFLNGSPGSPGSALGASQARPSLVLRPFITKKGVPIENLPAVDGARYRAVIRWDTRYGGTGAWDRSSCDTVNDVMRDVANDSFIHIGPVGGAGGFTHLSNWNPSGVVPPPDFLQAVAQVSWRGLSSIGGRSLSALAFACVVRAEIEIYLGTEHIQTIFSYHPVDLLFSPSATFNINLLYTTWPQFVNYDASGYNPQVRPAMPLQFRYGLHRFNDKEPFPVDAPPQVNNTRIAFIRRRGTERLWEFEPVPHFIANQWFYSSIQTNVDGLALAQFNLDAAAWGTTGVFIRPQVFRLITHGNADINAWDGRALVPGLNSQNEVILAPTVGAGWKHPTHNTFTGVLMGINTAKVKRPYEAMYGGFPAQATASRTGKQFMTGLFGFQNGFSSFSIMENGVATFGRADRGRIVLDGVNAQIYGGGSFFQAPGNAAYGDDDADTAYPTPRNPNAPWSTPGRGHMPMFNRMRLSFIDFRGAGTGSANDPAPYTHGGDMTITPGPAADGCRDINIATGPFRIPWEFRFFFTNDTAAAQQGVENVGSRQHGFGFGHGYATPAIEIGQYIGQARNLIRQLTIPDLREFSIQISNLEIPGNRRFLVTYDGTLYAMNAFIAGNIVSSNIVASQFFTGDASFAVTEDGNMAIGWNTTRPMARQIRAPYHSTGTSGWSRQRPEVTEFPLELRLPTANNIRSDFRGQSTAAIGQNQERFANFFVSQEGVVIAQEIHVRGGSFNIGSFFIVGDNPIRGADIFPPTTPTPAPHGVGAGDVVSFGTMYLVGARPNVIGEQGGASSAGGTPSLNAPPHSLEAWGDVYFRGKLTNLGHVFLGSTPEKRTGTTPPPAPGVQAPSLIANAMNSPFSITPTTVTGTDVDWPQLPIRMGMWPLYFHIDTNAITTQDNRAWVSFASNPQLAIHHEFINNGYMPSFSLRVGANEDSGPTVVPQEPGGIEFTMARHVVWRVDQLGQWSDGILFTRSTWASLPLDNVAYNINQHALLYMGWAETTMADSDHPTGFFTIRNMARAGSNMLFETPTVLRLSAGRWDVFRGSTPGGVFERTGAVILDTYEVAAAAPSGTNNRRAVMAVHSRRDAGIVTAGTIMLAGKRDPNPDGGGPYREGPNADNADIDAFMVFNNIGWGDSTTENQVHDERGQVIANVPNRGGNTNGFIWTKGRSVVMDALSGTGALRGANHVPQANNSMNAQFRLNRTSSGDPEDYVGPDDAVPWDTIARRTEPETDGDAGTNHLLGHAHVLGHHGVNIIGGTSPNNPNTGFIMLHHGSGRRITLVHEGIWLGFTPQRGIRISEESVHMHYSDTRFIIEDDEQMRIQWNDTRWWQMNADRLRWQFSDTRFFNMDGSATRLQHSATQFFNMDGTTVRIQQSANRFMQMNATEAILQNAANQHFRVNANGANMAFGARNINLNGSELRVSGVPAGQQHGIYARFG